MTKVGGVKRALAVLKAQENQVRSRTFSAKARELRPTSALNFHFSQEKANESTGSKCRAAADGLIKPGVQVLLRVELVEPAHVLGRINAMEVTALMS